MSIHRTSRIVLSKREEFENVAHTFGNLGFEDIEVPDNSWFDGVNFGRAGVGLFDAFENFSEYPTGVIPAGGRRTDSAGAGGAVDIIAAIDGHSLVADLQGDATPTDSLIVSQLNAGAAVANPAVGYYSCWIRTDDVTKRGYFIIADATAAATFVGMGFNNSTWVVLNAGAWAVLADLGAPVNDTWYHVVVVHSWAGNVTQVAINGIWSAVNGSVFGVNPPADLSLAMMLTGSAAFGVPTNGTNHVYFDAVDFSEIPGWVIYRNTLELPRTELLTAASFYYTWTSAATLRNCNIRQDATITSAINPRVLADIWISQETYDSPQIAGANLVVNGTIDVNLNGWIAGGCPNLPWMVGAITRDVGDPQAGAGALQLAAGANTFGFATNDFIAVGGGWAYQLNYWIKRQIGIPDFALSITYYDIGYNQIGSLDIIRPLSPSPAAYTEYNDYIYPPWNAAYIRIHFGVRGAVTTAYNVDEMVLQRAVLPYLRVQDDAGPTDFYMTPRYTAEGWYLMDLQYVRTGNTAEIAFLGSCYYGTIIIDNVRIE